MALFASVAAVLTANPLTRFVYRVIDTLRLDIVRAARRLSRHPGFAAASVLTLALGIGASTTVFSIANWIAFRPVPGVSEPDRLVTVEYLGQRPTGPINYTLSTMDIRDINAWSSAITVAGYAPFEFGVTSGDAPARTVHGQYVTDGYFAVLGVRLASGSDFTPEQFVAAPVTPVAIISDDLRRALFTGVTNPIGRTIRVNGFDIVVTGVAERAFKGPRLLGDIDLWLPGSAYFTLARYPAAVNDPVNQRALKQFSFAFGRLSKGATIERAREQLAAARDRLVETYPTMSGMFKGLAVTLQRGIGVPPRQREAVMRLIAVLFTIGGLMVFIALANATNLFLFRTTATRGALTVERVLGASTWRVVRERATEALMLAVVAGLGAAVLAIWLSGFFQGRLVPSFETFNTRIGVDWRVFGFAVALSSVLGLLLGILPGLVEPRVDLASELKTRVAVRGSSVGRRTRSILTTAQVAISAALLVGALLFAGTLRNLRTLDMGLDPREIITVWSNFPAGGYAAAEAPAVVDRVRERLVALPGVAHVSFSNSGPFFEMGGANRLRRAGDPVDTTVFYGMTRVMPGYFRTLGIPLLRGRDFTNDDVGLTTGERPAILSRSAARRFFGDADPIGEPMTWGQSAAFQQPARVIGVVEDVNWRTLGQYGSTYAEQTYAPMGDGASWISMFTVVHTPGGAVTPAEVRRAIGEVAPSLPAFRVGTAAEQIEYNLSERRLLANAATLSSILAVLLACLGLYAVVAFAVAERTREFGIRVALGAQAREVLAMVLREAGVIGGVGVIAGLGFAAAGSRLIQNRLYGLDALDPRIYLAAAIMMLVLVAVASLVPARAATRVDPMVALRAE